MTTTQTPAPAQPVTTGKAGHTRQPRRMAGRRLQPAVCSCGEPWPCPAAADPFAALYAASRALVIAALDRAADDCTEQAGTACRDCAESAERYCPGCQDLLDTAARYRELRDELIGASHAA